MTKMPLIKNVNRWISNLSGQTTIYNEPLALSKLQWKQHCNPENEGAG